MSVNIEHRGLIDFYTKTGSRNGAKIAIILEELGLQYRLHKIDPSDKAFDKEAFLAISPNGHIPALTDVHPNGNKVYLTESGSIVQYLIAQYDNNHRISYAKSSPEEIEVNNWFFFGTSRVGPNHDEAVHFSQEAPQKIPYSIERFSSKTMGLFFILEQHLEKTRRDYLAGSKCTIADIAHVPFIVAADAAGIDIEKFPHLTAWYNRMLRRPAVKKGLAVVEREPATN
ncbi:hypothetical protein VTN77DRAFT_6850 [Rasamsonia byssochlamydoides]|uniref:uncharacterized protein n=1 Tax=Rasamsonia byssochlamydoides TaxID=89139 RepID=UPI0037445677